MALCSMLRQKFLNLKKFLAKKGCKRVQSSSRVPRSLSDLVEALRKHVALLSDFSRKAFDEGDANYLGEIAAKLRLLVWDGGRSNKPLLLKLMRVFEIEVPITLGGPPIQPPPGQPGPGDQISLQEYLDLLSAAIRVPSQGLVEISNLELIRTIAEQHGAAHEDWSHDETYSTLRGFNLFIGGRQVVEATLLPITNTVLHVAGRFLDSLTPSLIVTKNAERQLSYANQKLALDPADSFARQLRGEALGNLGNYRKASREFKTLVEDDPSNARAHNALGLALLRLGKLPESVSSFERAIELREGFGDAHYNLACSHSLLGNFRSSLSELAQAKKIDGFQGIDPLSDPDLEKILNDPDYGRQLRALVEENASGESL